MTQLADAIVREQVYLSLVPFFLEAAEGNVANARAAVEELINAFNPANAEDVLLVAQIVTYGMAGLESLRRSAEKPDLPVSMQLRLRGNANAMQRASQTCHKALDQRRKAAASPIPQPQSAPAVTEADLQAALKRATAVIAEARTAGQLPPMNREARRAAEREAQRAIKHAAAQLTTAG